jgi:3D (Asp-Asp-Asp) domain-containing protein
MNKKWICSMVAAGLVLSAMASDARADGPFRDIEGSFARTAIKEMHASGMLTGYPDGTFRPDAPITRAEFAALLLKTKGLPLPDVYEGVFRDVQRGEWFQPYAELSYRLGVTSGSPARDFEPDKHLTREEMVKMTVNALGPDSERARRMGYVEYSTAINPFADRGEISPWAVKQIAFAIQEGMLHGSGDRLEPQKVATRAEVAAFLYRSLYPRPRGPHLVPVSRGNLNFFDRKNAEATAYTHTGNLSSIGLSTREGLVAVDPAQIPLGTHVYIPGYGYGIAGDTGGNIRQARVDLFYNSYHAAIQFGRKPVEIFLLD